MCAGTHGGQQCKTEFLMLRPYAEFYSSAQKKTTQFRARRFYLTWVKLNQNRSVEEIVNHSFC